MTDNKPATSNLLSQITSLVKTTTALASQDIEFQCAVDTSVQESVDQVKHKVISLINDLFLNVSEHNEVLVENEELSINDAWKQVGDVLDSLLEKSDKYIDEVKRIKGSTANERNMQYLDDSANHSVDHARKRISKPQLDFKTPVDNSEETAFKPKLQSKPFAIKSLEESLVLIPQEEGVPEHYNNPYEHEIMNQEYNSKVLEKLEPIPSRDWNTTSAKWIDSVDAVVDMVDDLKKYTEIAVDLEHHSLRSYYGITCLMQISTRDQDYLVDTIALRDDLQLLNEVFCNPSIIKILHGAFMDIIWLQRDLGLYVVGLFDTYHASRALGFPKHGLAYLLETFAHFKTSKKYQLADWRIRPLTPPLLAYARSDTHFLLNIFDQLRNKLVEQDKLKQVLYDSRGVARRRFEYNRFRPKAMSGDVYCTEEKLFPWKALMNNYNIPYELEPLVTSLFEWRDLIARRDDESPAYVMPNQLLVTLVSLKPTEAAGVLSVSNMISDYMRTNAKALANIIKQSLKSIGDENLKKNNRYDGSFNKAPSQEVRDKAKLISRENVEFALNIVKGLQDTFVKKVDLPSGNALLSSSAFFEGDKFWNNDFVSYESDKKTIVDKQNLVDRNESLQQAFSKDMELQQIMMAQDSAVVEANEPSASTESAQPSEEVVPKVKENKDDIIVLKTRNTQSKAPPTKKKDEFADEDVVAIDYENVAKVMDSSNNFKNNRKKRNFNPFAAESEGPQAYNKKHKPSKGKNVSFKNKK